MTGVPLAFAAGMLTVAAPCVLPMLPVVLGASVGRQGRWRPVFIAGGFAASFTVVALLFHLVTQALGLSHELLRQVAAGLLLVFGVLMVWPTPFYRLATVLGGPLERIRVLGDGAGAGNAGGALLGVTLGALWTPCAGPVLASILALAAGQENLAQAAVLMGAYSVGAALPMLAIAYGGQAASARVRQLARHTRRLQQGFGVLVVAVALAMFFEWDSVAVVWLSDWYPGGRLGL